MKNIKPTEFMKQRDEAERLCRERRDEEINRAFDLAMTEKRLSSAARGFARAGVTARQAAQSISEFAGVWRDVSAAFERNFSHHFRYAYGSWIMARPPGICATLLAIRPGVDLVAYLSEKFMALAIYHKLRGNTARASFCVWVARQSTTLPVS